MKELRFNNISAKDINFSVTKSVAEPLTQEEYELIQVEGRNGRLVVNKGCYPDIERVFTITPLDYFEEDDIPTMVNDIKRWLLDITDNKLFYAYVDRYHIVKKVIISDINTSLEEFGDIEVTFICEPFLYKVEDIITIVEATTITNDGDFASYPNIKIYGTGNIQLTINNDTIQINNVNNYVELDSKLLICKNEDGTSKSKDLIGGFLTLDKGENNISYTGNVTKIEITKRTIYR